MWAAFLVPMWLRRHDRAAETKSVDRFARKMRILARRPKTYGSDEERAVPDPARAPTPTGTVRIVRNGPGPAWPDQAPGVNQLKKSEAPTMIIPILSRGN